MTPEQLAQFRWGLIGMPPHGAGTLEYRLGLRLRRGPQGKNIARLAESEPHAETDYVRGLLANELSNVPAEINSEPEWSPEDSQ